jgi:hypothetical protein
LCVFKMTMIVQKNINRNSIMSEERRDAHAILDELREMIVVNTNVDWDVQHAAEEFDALLEFIDKRRPVTEVHIGVEMYKGLINDVVASKTSLEDRADPHNNLTKEELYAEETSEGWIQYITLLEE